MGVIGVGFLLVFIAGPFVVWGLGGAVAGRKAVLLSDKYWAVGRNAPGALESGTDDRQAKLPTGKG